MILSEYNQKAFAEAFNRVSITELEELYKSIKKCYENKSNTEKTILIKDSNTRYLNHNHKISEDLWNIEPHIYHKLKQLNFPYINKNEINVYVTVHMGVMTFEIKSKYNMVREDIYNFINDIVESEKGKVHRYLPLKEQINYLANSAIANGQSMYCMYEIPKNYICKNRYESMTYAAEYIINDHIPFKELVDVKVSIDRNFFLLKAYHHLSEFLYNRIISKYSPFEEVIIEFSSNDKVFINNHLPEKIKGDNKQIKTHLEYLLANILKEALDNKYKTHVVYEDEVKKLYIIPEEIYMRSKVKKTLLEIMSTLNGRDIKSLYKNIQDMLNEKEDVHISRSFDIDPNLEYEFYSKDSTVENIPYWPIELSFGNILDDIEITQEHRKRLSVRFTIKNGYLTFYISHNKEVE